MSICFDLSVRHSAASANAHYYREPTKALYLDRVLEYHDLIYLVDGSWSITEGETEYPLERDDVLLLTAGEHHYTRLPCAPGTRTMCIHVVREPGDSEGCAWAMKLPTCIRTRGYASPKRYFEEITDAYWSVDPHKDDRIAALFNLLVLDLARIASQPARHDIADEVIRLVNSSSHVNYRASDMADKFYVSTKTINNTMQRRVGMSFAKYQMNRKLEMVALHLEVEPDVSLSEIAAMFGFCDEFHLSKNFKKKYGVSPSQYRQMPR